MYFVGNNDSAIDNAKSGKRETGDRRSVERTMTSAIAAEMKRARMLASNDIEFMVGEEDWFTMHGFYEH